MLELVRRSTIRCASLPLVVATALSGCAVAGGPTAVPRSPAPSPAVAVSDPPAASPGTSVGPSGTIAAGPPVAALSAEGGDPADGQLGTYTWGDGGSDSPWLPGTRMAVGSAEPLTVTLRPAFAIEAWSARAVPATAVGPAGATVLGQGSGSPRFMAPSSGTWTVEVRVVFADAAGKASYFWQLAVD